MGAEALEKVSLYWLCHLPEAGALQIRRIGELAGSFREAYYIEGTQLWKKGIFKKEENAVWISIKADEDFLDYVVYKGSITIDGVSLTVAYVDKKILKVSIIPHTKESTTLLGKKVGDLVNLESDIIGKYVKRFMINFNEGEKEKNKSNIDLDFLMKNGF